jgi:hypothetical protein
MGQRRRPALSITCWKFLLTLVPWSRRSCSNNVSPHPAERHDCHQMSSSSMGSAVASSLDQDQNRKENQDQEHPDGSDTSISPQDPAESNGVVTSPSPAQEMNLIYHMLALTSTKWKYSPVLHRQPRTTDNKQATHQQAHFSRQAAPWHVPETLGVIEELDTHCTFRD